MRFDFLDDGEKTLSILILPFVVRAGKGMLASRKILGLGFEKKALFIDAPI